MRPCGGGGGGGGGVPASAVAPLLVYCLLSLTAIFFQEVHPLWLVAPVASGGLGWDAHRIGG